MLKRLLFLFGCATCGFGAVMFFFWHQATQLPSWYTNSSTTTTANALPQTDQTQIQPTQKQVWRKVSERLGKPGAKGEVQLDANEVNALIAGEIAKTSDEKLAAAIKGTNTQIESGKISVGAVIDPKAIPLNKLPKQEQAKISQLLKTASVLGDNQLYVAVEGKPTVRNQKVNLDDTTRIKLGNISWTLTEMSQRLGVSPESLSQLFSQELQKLPVKVNDVEIVGDRLVVRGAKTAG